MTFDKFMVKFIVQHPKGGCLRSRSFHEPVRVLVSAPRLPCSYSVELTWPSEYASSSSQCVHSWVGRDVVGLILEKLDLFEVHRGCIPFVPPYHPLRRRRVRL